MTTSMFIEYVQDWFKPIVKSVIETVNGTKEAPKYLHDVYLAKEESLDLKWGTLSGDGVVVMADVVALDSELPLKSRDSISKVTGDIPKLGMKLYLNERQLSEISILKKKDGKEAQLVGKIFADAKRSYVGVKERLEYMFLEALSSGVTSVVNASNIGTEIRIDFGVPAENQFGTVGAVWSDIASTPITDIENMVQRARDKGDTLSYIFMDKTAFNNFKKATQVKEQYAFYVGFTGSTIPVPNVQKASEFLQADFGLSLIIVDRKVQWEKDGSRTVATPWVDGAVTFTTTLDLGTLTYGSLAEMENPVEGVSYEVADGFVLISKYRKNDPVREFTSSQALAIPVLDNVSSLYFLDSKTAI